jgi:hypothetical protein
LTSATSLLLSLSQKSVQLFEERGQRSAILTHGGAHGSQRGGCCGQSPAQRRGRLARVQRSNACWYVKDDCGYGCCGITSWSSNSFNARLVKRRVLLVLWVLCG